MDILPYNSVSQLRPNQLKIGLLYDTDTQIAKISPGHCMWRDRMPGSALYHAVQLRRRSITAWQVAVASGGANYPDIDFANASHIHSAAGLSAAEPLH